MTQSRRWRLAVALLSISVLLTSANAIAGTIPLMAARFQSVPLSQIESLTTVPSFSILIFVVLSNPIANKIGNKATVLLGVLIVLIAGLIPMVVNSFWLILGSRFLLGAGIGLFNAMAYSLISTYYEGTQRQTMMGYQGSVSSLGNILMFLISSFLIGFGWRQVYLYYLIAIPVFLLFWWGTPNDRAKSTTEEAQSAPQSPISLGQLLKGRLMIYALLVLFSMMIAQTVVVKISGLILAAGYGKIADGSIALALLGIATMIGGMLYGQIFKLIHRLILPAGLLIAAVALFALSRSQSLALTYTLTIIAGLSTSLVGPYLFAGSAEIAGKGNETLASSILIVGINIGVFITPYTLSGLSHLIGSDQPAPILAAVSVILAVIGGLTFLLKEPELAEHRQ
ncbi:MFS transporter [Lentilactobacillus fungorum]|uniref:MFS transporter n=1 Tax=Lentilactobacillus fungorum TaxID=2201250 RepID=A0ABQ3W263_9LACO|nr:MFS transporter [Lentilactobacillus fungorum]GHP14381.1 MFS transporter [Lentilactobacillus fungorum]